MTKLWRTKMAVSIKCPCLTFSAAMWCLDAKISLVPKHNPIVPSTLLAPATHIQTDKATKPQEYILLGHWHMSYFFKIAQKLMFTWLFKFITKFTFSMISNMVLAANTVLNMQCSTLWIPVPYSVTRCSKTYKLLNIGATVCFNGCQTSNVWHPSIRTFLTSTFRSYFIFLNCQAYLFLRNSTLASRNYS